MEHQTRFEQEETTIDLKQLFCYLVRKWKMILILVLVGALIGAGFGMVKKENSAMQYDAKKAELYKIYQKHEEDYQQLIEDNAHSALLQMNPGNVYSAVQTFQMSAPDQTSLNQIIESYNALLKDPALLQELADASGLVFDVDQIAELLTINVEKEPVDAGASAKARLMLNIIAPTKENYEALSVLLTSRLQELTQQMQERIDGYECEMFFEKQQYGYSEEVFKAHFANKTLLEHKEKLMKDKKAALTNAEIEFYANDPSPEEAASSSGIHLKAIIKWMIIVAVVFGVLAVGAYGMFFLMNNTIKAADALLYTYGLYVIAYMSSGRKENWAEKHFSGDTLPINNNEYLHNAIESLCTENTIISGDMKNSVISNITKDLDEKFPALRVLDQLAAAEAALPAVKDSDGVILVIQLWKTTDMELRREIEIARKLQKPVKGVVVVKA